MLSHRLLVLSLVAATFTLLPSAHASPCAPSEFSAAPCAVHAVGKLGETCDSLDCGPNGIVREIVHDLPVFVDELACRLTC